MKAVVFDRFGGPEVLQVRELPMPTPGAADVVVKVVAATVNPTDLLMRSGQHAAFLQDLSPPYIAGMEFAGVVHAVGSDAAHLHAGQPVMGFVNPRRPQGGAQAQYVCLPAASVAALPEGTDLIGAATVPMNGLTARMCIDAVALPTGSTLLVTGGAGAVGAYVIALARQAGLHVIADAKDSDRALLQQLGATEVVPRGEAMAHAVRAAHPAGVDAVVDGALLGDAAAALLRDGGTFVSLRRDQPVTRPGLRVVEVRVLQQVTNTAALEWLAQRHADGTLAARVAARLPAAQAVQAHRLAEQGGLRGRVVLLF